MRKACGRALGSLGRSHFVSEGVRRLEEAAGLTKITKPSKIFSQKIFYITSQIPTQRVYVVAAWSYSELSKYVQNPGRLTWMLLIMFYDTFGVLTIKRYCMKGLMSGSILFGVGWILIGLQISTVADHKQVMF